MCTVYQPMPMNVVVDTFILNVFMFIKQNNYKYLINYTIYICLVENII